MKPETLFLKIAVFIMAVPVLALCIFVIPVLTRGISEFIPAFSFWVKVASAGIYLSAVLYFLVLYQALRLLGYIDKNKAFSHLSVKALKNIKYYATTISILFLLTMPLVYAVAEKDDAPGLIIVGMVIALAPMVVAVFAAVLQKLLKNAINIKKENDLTV
ncbi:Protein of unknown function [Gracilibacillus ureilyticus]|uniref:DUF2975 domain-containing protein n=1 Tax=Gracilibacillus ureilyticus TaxID=531814 RepID=A0A1H9RJ59_9BACI|nr:DUF2975 domain-containing protein [Gracilibacillus ureilyticus]SER72776.1 Protein of unknown function [Gracilibacillus ureilyticus]